MLNLKPNKEYTFYYIDEEIGKLLISKDMAKPSIAISDTVIKKVFNLEFIKFYEIRKKIVLLTQEHIDELNKEITLEMFKL